jgi:hypothetical protein
MVSSLFNNFTGIWAELSWNNRIPSFDPMENSRDLPGEPQTVDPEVQK